MAAASLRSLPLFDPIGVMHEAEVAITKGRDRTRRSIALGCLTPTAI
jgi:hypothetical protein